MIFNAVATALAVTSVVTRISLTSSFSSSLIQQSADVTQRSKSRLPVSLLSTIDSSVLDYRAVNKLSFRELQKACKDRSLTAAGPTAVLRIRLLESSGIAPREEKPEVDNELCETEGISFFDGDTNFLFNTTLYEVMDKASVGHWKSATRKLKKLRKCYSTEEMPVPRDAYIAVLQACLNDRLHGARASEPARKILEEMVDQGYSIPPEMGNQCVSQCIGVGPSSTHDGFGGIDTALAMLAAMESSPDESNIIDSETYGDVVSALCRDGALAEALLLLQAMVVEHSFTPDLSVFVDVSQLAVKVMSGEIVLEVMSLAKQAGYVLDDIASVTSGRSLLANGVIAAEQTDNISLGLRILTAAGSAEGCLPDRGDNLVASSSSSAQRASTLLHKRAIDKAIEGENWKLAVAILTLMPERSLTPSASVFRKVVALCCKCEKSRKATAILLDWVTLSERGEIKKPPLKVFNSVVNTCEICKEEELTLLVLETMKKTHTTDGNIITFNIALKRLARLGQMEACESIIVGMLEENVEPNVVSYTTAIGACARAKDSVFAMEWLSRMRSRNVNPNFHTYNTALASCLDGKLESTLRASQIVDEMMNDVQLELREGLKGIANYNSVIPDKYTEVLTRSLMKQLRDNWKKDQITKEEATNNVRLPFVKLLTFDKSEQAAEIVKRREEEKAASLSQKDAECLRVTEMDECEIDFNAINKLHDPNHRTFEV